MDAETPATSGKNPGTEYKVGYKKPPIETRFGGPRAPRNGRKPKSFDQLRALAQSISNEPATTKDGAEVIVNGHVATQGEMVLRQMMHDNPERFVEIAYGKVPTPIEATIKRVGIEFVHEDVIATLAAGSNGDSVPSGDGQGDQHGPALGQDDYGD